MTTPSKEHNPEARQQQPAGMDRRDFIAKSAAVGAGAALVAGAVSQASAQEAEAEGTSSMDWRTAKPGKRDSAMYTEQVGYEGKDQVNHWPGRGISGAMIGLVQINSYTGSIPMAPGNMGNATTFDFPLLYRPMDAEDLFDIMALTPKADFTDRIVDAAKWLELQGVRAIIGNCGFFGTYQNVVQDRIDTPFFSSSLMQLPMMLRSMPRDKKVGVVTANSKLLGKCPAIENCGLSLEDKANRIVIAGCQDDPEFENILNITGKLNMGGIEKATVNGALSALKKDPNIGAILLECTELAPHAQAVQEAVRLPVWDYTTLTTWVYSGCLRRPFTGAI